MTISTTIAKLKVRVVNTLKNRGPLKFGKLARSLRINDELREKRLDNVLQELRRGGQIHFSGPIHGWVTGKGRVYSPNQRFN